MNSDSASAAAAGEQAPAEQPVINIRGERVALGPMRRDLAPTYYRWMNDLDGLKRAGFPIKPRTLEQIYSWIERITGSTSDIWFVMYELASWKPIGDVGLKDIDQFHRSAEFGIAIWEPWARGKGYGTEAARLMLDHAFNALALHSVFLMTQEYNIAGQRAYAKAGFKEFGRRRQSDMMGGKLWDLVYMDCLAAEFESPVLARLFAPEPPRQAQSSGETG